MMLFNHSIWCWEDSIMGKEKKVNKKIEKKKKIREKVEMGSLPETYHVVFRNSVETTEGRKETWLFVSKLQVLNFGHPLNNKKPSNRLIWVEGRGETLIHALYPKNQ